MKTKDAPKREARPLLDLAPPLAVTVEAPPQNPELHRKSLVGVPAPEISTTGRTGVTGVSTRGKRFRVAFELAIHQRATEEQVVKAVSAALRRLSFPGGYRNLTATFADEENR